jgi:hypothetical protein
LTLLFALIGCAPKAVRVPIAIDSAHTPNKDYLDLVPGSRLRVVVPLLKSGGFQVASDNALPAGGSTMVLSAQDLAGYQVSFYAIEDRGKGRVRLSFTSAQTTKDGKTVVEQTAPELPFPLPVKVRHIRLVYLVRRSQVDHNMAIAAAKNIDALNRFTERLRHDPAICRDHDAISCTWVPSGIAVRPEPL